MELNMCQIGAILELCDKKCCIFLEDKYLVYRRVYISHVV